MNCIEVKDKTAWNQFVISCRPIDGGLLQSWQWGEFQKNYGRQVFRIGIIANGKIIFGWQIIKMALPLGMSYFYAPRIIQKSNVKSQNYNSKFKISDFFNSIKQLAKKEKAIFIRVDATPLIPPLARGETEGSSLKDFGFKKTNLSIQPQEELIVDISKEIDQLLSEMKPKTRYNIRLAEKHNVEIKSFDHSIGEQNFNNFFELLKLTAQRQKIRLHPREYYQKMIKVLMAEKMAKLYIGTIKDKAITAALITCFGNAATYLHGGSDDNFRQAMAPYRLHWQAILDAKQAGLNYYNFGGVSSNKESWAGITRFKTGFSPNTEFINYAGVWDMPIRPFIYFCYQFIKKIKN